MKFEIEARELLRVLDTAFGAVKTSKKAIDATLACFTLEAKKGGTLRVYGTDLEVAILTWTDAHVAQEGSKLIQAKFLHDVAKALPRDGIVKVAPKKNQLELKCGKIRFAFGTIDPSWENIPKTIEEIETRQIGREMLRSMLDQTMYAASTDDTRVNLAGVHFTNDGTGKLRLVATDGHRLALTQGPVGFGTDNFQSVTVPIKGCTEIRKLLGEDNRAEIGFDDKRIVLRSGTNTILTCQLVEHGYPNYEQVIPKDGGQSLKVDRAMMVDALSRLKLLQDKSTATVLSLSGSTLTLETQTADKGQGQEDLDVEYEGEDLRIGFNGIYLSDVCRAFECEHLEIKLIDPLSPGVIVDPTNPDLKAVIMPMRI